MDALIVGGVILALLTLLSWIRNLDETKRILKGKMGYLKARIKDITDIEKASSAQIQGPEKTTKDKNHSIWVTQCSELLKLAEDLLTQVEDSRSFLTTVMNRKAIEKVVDALAVHDMLYTKALSDEQGIHRCNYIPVKEKIGKAAINTFEELKHLLQDAKVGRVAIRGREGICKTFITKHLHNCVLQWADRFAYVFWITSPIEFSIKNLQDSVAAVVKCDLASEDDSVERARKLSNALASLENFVLFIDGVPKADFSMDQIGIPFPAEESECKLVITTSCTLACRILDGFRTVELDCIPEQEAFELFIQEAKIDMTDVTLLDSTPRLLVKKCYGVPRTIVNIASYMCGVDDLHEWRNALFESINIEKQRTKLPSQVIVDEPRV